MSEAPPTADIEREFCDFVDGPTQARCHKEPGHEGPHNGWAHYPGQIVSWEDAACGDTGPGSDFGYPPLVPCLLPRGHEGEHCDSPLSRPGAEADQ